MAQIKFNPGITVCTSTTRPTSPYQGQEILETDKSYRRVWDGTAWRFVARLGGDAPFAAWSTHADINWPNGGEVFGGSASQDANTDTTMFTYVAGTALGNGQGTAIKVNEDGRYRLDGFLPVYYTPLGNNYYGVMAFRIWNPGTVAPAIGTAAYELNSTISANTAPNSQYMDLPLSGEVWLTAGSWVSVFANASPLTGFIVRSGVRLTVQRVG